MNEFKDRGRVGLKTRKQRDSGDVRHLDHTDGQWKKEKLSAGRAGSSPTTSSAGDMAQIRTAPSRPPKTMTWTEMYASRRRTGAEGSLTTEKPRPSGRGIDRTLVTVGEIGRLLDYTGFPLKVVLDEGIWPGGRLEFETAARNTFRIPRDDVEELERIL